MKSNSTEKSKGDILVVDDTPTNLRLLSSLLSERGYDVRKAINGKLALIAASSHPPDIILLDIMMPDMDGYEVCQQLKASPKTCEVPVIFLSALNDVVDKIKAFEFGGVDYITKPFQIQEVVARVENQLTIVRQKKQLSDQNALLSLEIRNRQQAEMDLSRSNAVLKAQQEAALDGILVFDEYNEIAFCNHRFCELWALGQKSERMASNRLDMELVLSKLEKPQEFLDKIYYLSQHRQEISRDEIIFQDGRVFDRYSGPVLSNFGDFYGRIWFFREITDRKKAEAALRYSEEKHRALLNAIPDLMFRIRQDGMYLDYRGTKEGLAKFPQELIGKKVSDVLPADLAEWTMHYVRETLQSDEMQQGEYVERVNNQWHHYEARYVRCGEDEVLVIMRDITERKQAEAARLQSEALLRVQTHKLQQALDELKRTQIQLIQSEKMSGLGQLVAGIAHEINNPVTFIYGNINHACQYIKELLALIDLYQEEYPQPTERLQELLENSDLDFLKEDLQKLIDSMKVGAERIRKIVQSLRNFSRLDEAQMKPVDIHEGIDSTLTLLHNRLGGESGENKISVIRQYGKLPRVTCYAGELNQVFMNIINNAIDALHEAKNQGFFSDKEPLISIRTELDNENLALVRITDNGPGIKQDILPRIFDPFFTTKSVGRGTGLGLSISYSIIVDSHAGRLNCVSAPGEGTEFQIAIPLHLDKISK